MRLSLSACVRLSIACLLAVAASISDAQAQGLQVFEGTLQVVWGDPDPLVGRASGLAFSLAFDDGRVLPLRLNGRETAALHLFRRRVIVTARMRAPGSPAGQPEADVDAIALSTGAEPSAATPSAAVLNPRRVIFLLVKFPEDTTVPHPASFYTNITNPETPPPGSNFPSTLNGFFNKTSFNQFSWAADVGGVGGIGAPGGWLTLPRSKSYYANCGSNASCAQLQPLAEDAIALGRAQGISFATYDNINFVLSNDLDCCAWGGTYYSATERRSFGATWEPPWGQNVPTYAHEMGHSIGLPHSGWAYYAYDSPWDTMSSVQTLNGMVCGSYRSANTGFQRSLVCAEPGDGYIGAHRDTLGWIPAANEAVVDATTETTVTIEASATPLSSAVKLLKICLPAYPCTGSAARFFTVEARVKGIGALSQFDNAVPGEGIIIHDVRMDRPAISGGCYFNSQSGWAVPVDATPGDYDAAACRINGTYPNYGLFNAQWVVGQTYTNNLYQFGLSVVSRTATSFTVSVFSGVQRNPVSRSDFDADRRSEIAVFRPADGSWRMLESGTGYGASASQQMEWGAAGDTPVPGDFDGDGHTDVAVYRPASGEWFARCSSRLCDEDSPLWFQWGLTGDLPMVGDFDGDRKAEITVYRPSTGQWFIRYSSLAYAVAGAYGLFQLGTPGDIPLATDFDGDGKSDLAVYRPSSGLWLVRYSTQGFIGPGVSYQWGLPGDTPLVTDFDGDGRTDLTVYRPSTGEWYTRLSSRGYSASQGAWYQWGLVGDIPVVLDYDGDGRTDLTVYRPGTAEWFIRSSSQQYSTATGAWYQWGLPGDLPLPR